MNKTIALTAVTALCCALTACRSHKTMTRIADSRSDSLRTEYRERVEYIPDTVPFKLQPQEAERITPDSVSRLETDYAVSVARVSEDGMLHHTLTTKTQTIAVPTFQKQTTRDSIIYRVRLITRTQTKTIEKGLSPWQKTQIWGLWALLALVLITYTIKKVTTHIRENQKK